MILALCIVFFVCVMCSNGCNILDAKRYDAILPSFISVWILYDFKGDESHLFCVAEKRMREKERDRENQINNGRIT